jgi:small subunit ribosomal protein S3
MAQKINPISLRLERTNRTIDSSWFNQCNYVNLLMKDLKIQWYINLILKKIKFCSARYSILHLPSKIKVNIFFYNGNKNKKHICKIFYLNYPKKTKTIQKKFFNQAHIKFSVKQKQISNYLIKSFNDEFSNQLILQTNSLESKNYKNYKHWKLEKKELFSRSSTDKKHVSLLQNALSIKNTVKNNANILFENYLKLIYFIKSYNQFYIRYFLIKYFSMKSVFNLVDEKKNLNFIEKVLSTKTELNNKRTHCSFSSLQKAQFYNKISFKYILGFLFLQIYKNKKFLALKYFQIKINNYKKVFPVGKGSCLQNSNMIFNKPKIHKFKQNFYDVNVASLEKEYNRNYLNLDSIQNFIFFKHKKSKILFYTNFVHLKLNILDFLTKNTLNYIQLFKLPKKNNQSNLNGLMKLRKASYKLQFSVKNIYGINSNNITNHNVFNEPVVGRLRCKATEKSFLQNDKHYNLSLLNAECINDIYNHYCKLFKLCKHYDNIYLSAHTNYKKNFFSLPQNKKLNTYVDSLQTDISTILNETIIPEKTKVILPSSPYKSHIETILCSYFSCNVNFQFFQTCNIFQNSFFLIDEVIYYIEKRVPFFKIKNYILKKLAEQKSNGIKGIRIMCSGRVGGKSKKAQRSKIQNFKYGETSLHVFSSKIDFKSKNAFTSFGTLGIKVWICYR